MKRTFIELAGVTRLFRLAGVSDDHLRELQRHIMYGAGDVIQGTGGLRKIRCAVAGRGKSGGLRVVFADYPATAKCVLVAAFAKNVKENLSKAERQILAHTKLMLDQRYGSQEHDYG
jgi:hypothetical protein